MGFEQGWIERCARRFVEHGGESHADAVNLAQECFDNRIHPEDRPEDAADHDIARRATHTTRAFQSDS